MIIEWGEYIRWRPIKRKLYNINGKVWSANWEDLQVSKKFPSVPFPNFHSTIPKLIAIWTLLSLIIVCRAHEQYIKSKLARHCVFHLEILYLFYFIQQRKSLQDILFIFVCFQGCYSFIIIFLCCFSSFYKAGVENVLYFFTRKFLMRFKFALNFIEK